MLRTDSIGANVRPSRFFEIHAQSVGFNWVSENGDIPQKSEFFAFSEPVERRNHVPIPSIYS